MAINLQRAKDHGLPDYNTARFAYGLVKLTGFEQINPFYGIDPVSVCVCACVCVSNWLIHRKSQLPLSVSGMHIVMTSTGVTSGLVVWRRLQ